MTTALILLIAFGFAAPLSAQICYTSCSKNVEYFTKTPYFVERANVPDLCVDPTFDASLATDVGVYFFKGKYYYHKTRTGLSEARYIRSLYPCAPYNLDAAFVSSEYNATFLFKGSLVWRYDNYELAEGYPLRISIVFEGIPSDLTAATVYYHEGRTTDVFFKNKVFYFNGKNGTDVGQKHFVGTLDDLQIDSAFRYYDGFTYLFVGDRYYKYDHVYKKVVTTDPVYPRSVAKYWFGCEYDTLV